MKRMSARYTRTKCMGFWKSHLQLKRISRQKGKVLFNCISPVSQTPCMNTIFLTSNIGIVPCTRVKSAGSDAQAYTREPLHKIICCWVLFPFSSLCIAAPSSQTKSKRQRSWLFFGLTVFYRQESPGIRKFHIRQQALLNILKITEGLFSGIRDQTTKLTCRL